MKRIGTIFLIIYLCIFITNRTYAQNRVLHLNIYEPGQPKLNITVIPPIFFG